MDGWMDESGERARALSPTLLFLRYLLSKCCMHRVRDDNDRGTHAPRHPASCGAVRPNNNLATHTACAMFLMRDLISCIHLLLGLHHFIFLTLTKRLRETAETNNERAPHIAATRPTGYRPVRNARNNRKPDKRKKQNKAVHRPLALNSTCNRS